MKSRSPFLNVRLFFVVLGALALAGCSVDMFSPATPDAGIAGREKYRTARPECAGFRLANPQLDPSSFRALIDCFGANGSLPELAQWVSEAGDADLRPAIDLLNEAFLADAGARADSREIVRELRRRGRWEAILAGMAPAFAEPERMRALFRLLSVGARSPLVVRTVTAFDPEGALAGVELAARVVGTPAFAELSRKVSADPLSPAERDRLSSLFLDFVRRPTRYHSAARLLDEMVAGKSAPVWSLAFGEGDEAQILDATSRFTLFTRDLATGGLRELALLHRGFHRPISCWGGGKDFSAPWENLAHELRVHAEAGEASLLGFVGRFAPLTAFGIQEICAVPREVFDHFPEVMRLTAGRTGGEYLKVLARFATAGMLPTTGYFVGEWGESLAEALAILEAKPWFGDLALVIAELDADDRGKISDWVRALLRDRKAWTQLAATWTRADLRAVFGDLGEVLGLGSGRLASLLGAVLELFESSERHPWFGGWQRVAVRAETRGLGALAGRPAFPKAMSAFARMAEDGRLAAVTGDVLELLAGGEAGGVRRVMIAPTASVRKSPRHLRTGADLLPRETRADFDDSLRACANLDLRATAASQRETFMTCLAGGGVDASAFIGLHLAQDWKLPGGSFLGSWAGLPLTPSERRELVAIFLGKRGGFPALTVEGIHGAVVGLRTRFFGADPGRLFRGIGRFQAELDITLERWRGFFGRIETLLTDPRLVSLGRAWRSLVDPALGDAAAPKAGPAPLPPTLTRDWVRELECVADERGIAARTAEISREFSEGVLGWERPHGKLPSAWEATELKARFRGLSESLASDRLRANLYAWLRALDPKLAADWFAARAADPRLVAVMDPGTRQLKVRWMTTLDRLESILVNSNFVYPLGPNYGLKFIGKFAEAWGDEPRERWPREIQARYAAGKRPPTLAEVFREIDSFVNWFENLGGIPSVPDCVAKDGAIARAAVEDPWMTVPDLVVPFSVKAKAFNLRQTLSVIRENLPGSESGHAGGMRFLRDLFWAIHSSAPGTDRDPADPARNPLRFFFRLGELGALRSVSRGLQTLEFASERAALADAFGGLRIAVGEPALDRVLAKFLRAPENLDALIDGAFAKPEFAVGTLAYGALSGIAVDRTLGLSPVLLRYLDSLLGDAPAPFPRAFFAELILRGGVSAPGHIGRLSTLRAPDASTREAISGLAEFTDSRILAALRALPVYDAIRLLESDPALRAEAFAQMERFSSGFDRQAPGDLLALPPELRRMIGLWCGRSAGDYLHALAERPDEAGLMIDGLLRSLDSPVFVDFLDSLLRELPD